jgi:hypothetical protein
MKKIITLAVVLFAFSFNTIAQQQTLDTDPVSIVFNLGHRPHSMYLDKSRSGSAARLDGLGKVVMNVKLQNIGLDGEGQFSLALPERNITYRGKYQIIAVSTSTGVAKSVALVADWENLAQKRALIALSNEIRWRALNSNARLVLNTAERRVYVTPPADLLINERGLELNGEEFSFLSGEGVYSINLTSFQGAVIFDADGSSLTMRTIDKGEDVTISIPKNATVSPTTKTKQKTRPRTVNKGDRPRVVS